MQVWMVRNKVNNLYAQNRCCYAHWVGKEHGSVFSTSSSLNDVIKKIHPAILDDTEIETYYLVKKDAIE